MNEEELSLDEHLEQLSEANRERRDVILDRARKALAVAREEAAAGRNVDPETIRSLEDAIDNYERFTVERPGLPPDAS